MSVSEIISPSDPRWHEALARLPHDVYHLPEYIRVSASYEGGEPVAFLGECAGTVLFAPLVLKRLPSALESPVNWRDATSPYGYPSPVTTPNPDADVLVELLSEFVRTCADSHIVGGFLRLHPLLGIAPTLLERFGTVVTHGQTVYVDLRPPIEEVVRQFKPDRRYFVRKLSQAGFITTMDEWTRLGEFARMYLETMRRVSADPFYLFPDCYFEDLHGALASHLHLCCVMSPSGDLAAAGMFSEHEGIVQYLFSATAEQYLNQSPSKLMLDAVIRWAKQRANTQVHLGGGLGARADSLFSFKSGFSPLRGDYRTCRIVFDESRYALLVARWQQLTGDTAGDRSESFPAYRRAPRDRALERMDMSVLAPLVRTARH